MSVNHYAVICDTYQDGHTVVEWGKTIEEAKKKAVDYAKAQAPDTQDGDVYIAKMLGKVNLNPTIEDLRP